MHSPIERETSHLKAHWGKDQDAPQCSLKKYILHFTAPTKQAHKLGRCDSYLRNLKLSLTHWLTHDWQEKVLGGAIPSKKCTLGIVWCIAGAVPSFQFIVQCRSESTLFLLLLVPMLAALWRDVLHSPLSSASHWMVLRNLGAIQYFWYPAFLIHCIIQGVFLTPPSTKQLI